MGLKNNEIYGVDKLPNPDISNFLLGTSLTGQPIDGNSSRIYQAQSKLLVYWEDEQVDTCFQI